MAKHVFKNARVKIGDVDLSTAISAVTISRTADETDATGLTAQARERIAGGLTDATVTISFFQDYGAGAVYATLAPMFNTIASVKVFAANAAGSTSASVTEPIFTIPCHVSQDTPVGGSIGDIATFDVTWPASGAMTTATTGTWATA